MESQIDGTLAKHPVYVGELLPSWDNGCLICSLSSMIASSDSVFFFSNLSISKSKSPTWKFFGYVKVNAKSVISLCFFRGTLHSLVSHFFQNCPRKHSVFHLNDLLQDLTLKKKQKTNLVYRKHPLWFHVLWACGWYVNRHHVQV